MEYCGVAIGSDIIDGFLRRPFRQKIGHQFLRIAGRPISGPCAFVSEQVYCPVYRQNRPINLPEIHILGTRAVRENGQLAARYCVRDAAFQVFRYLLPAGFITDRQQIVEVYNGPERYFFRNHAARPNRSCCGRCRGWPCSWPELCRCRWWKRRRSCRSWMGKP